MSFWDLFISRRDDTGTQSNIESQPDDAAGVLLRASLDHTYVDRDKAMMISAVNGCVTRISDDIAALPIRLYNRTDDRIVEADDRRTFLLNNETGDTLDGVDFKRAMIRDYYLGKGGYAFINRKGLEVESIHYVDEREISFMYNTDPIFKTFSLMIQGKKYDPDDFVIVLRNTRDGRSGISIQEEAQKLLSVSWGTLAYEESATATGGTRKGFIKLSHRVSQEIINRIKAAWRRLYSNDSENVVVLNEGMNFQEASSTATEMQINESKELAVKQICQLFGMPHTILSGGATEEDRKLYVEECLQPLCEKFATALNRALLLESEKDSYYFAFDLSERTKGDILTRYRAYEIASKNGFIQTDEIRFRENLPALGMEWIKLGLQDVLYDPTTQTVFTPNTGITSKIGEEPTQTEPTSEPPGTVEPSDDDQTEPAKDPERLEDRATRKKPKRRRGGDPR